MIRIGQGYDVHRLVEGRELWLCGVKVAHNLGLDGHSGAGGAIHALCHPLLRAPAPRGHGSHLPATAQGPPGT